MSLSSKPTVPVLNQHLRDLIDWQKFALHLPGVLLTHIQIIQRNEPNDVAKQKVALYDKWLRINPSGSWDDIFKALKEAEENRIMKELKDFLSEKVRYLIGRQRIV